jgi:hypothetical protein
MFDLLVEIFTIKLSLNRVGDSEGVGKGGWRKRSRLTHPHPHPLIHLPPHHPPSVEKNSFLPYKNHLTETCPLNRGLTTTFFIEICSFGWEIIFSVTIDIKALVRKLVLTDFSWIKNIASNNFYLCRCINMNTDHPEP